MSLFNPDGSLKLPDSLVRVKQENVQKLKTHRCIKIERNVIRDKAPKQCMLKLTLSDAIKDNRFVDTIYKEFKNVAAVPTKIRKISDKKFEIDVGTDFRRCSDCTMLRGKYRSFVGNVIDKAGNCTFEGRKSFSYEDYFD